MKSQSERQRPTSVGGSLEQSLSNCEVTFVIVSAFRLGGSYEKHCKWQPVLHFVSRVSTKKESNFFAFHGPKKTLL